MGLQHTIEMSVPHKGGKRTTSLSSIDDKIAAIIGETLLKGIVTERQPQRTTKFDTYCTENSFHLA